MTKFNYDIKERLVKEGNSNVFKNWHEFAGVTEEDFLEGLKWLCETEVNERGQKKRELGCSVKEGLVKLYRVFDRAGNFVGFYRYDNNMTWSGVSLSPDNRI